MASLTSHPSLAGALREMQARGRKIEITRARVRQGEAIAASAGTLGLTTRGGLDGQIQVTILGLESIVRSLDLDRAMSQGNVGSGHQRA